MSKPVYVVLSPPTVLEVVVGFIFQGAEGITKTVPHKLLHQVGIVVQLRICDDGVRVAHEYLLTLGLDAVDERQCEPLFWTSLDSSNTPEVTQSPDAFCKYFERFIVRKLSSLNDVRMVYGGVVMMPFEVVFFRDVIRNTTTLAMTRHGEVLFPILLEYPVSLFFSC